MTSDKEILPILGDSDCRYIKHGTDTDGTEWFMCLAHEELAPSHDAPCAKGVDEEEHYDPRPDKPWAEEHDDDPPHMERNANGSWYCFDCKCVVILFDEDKHYCDEKETNGDAHD